MRDMPSACQFALRVADRLPTFAPLRKDDNAAAAAREKQGFCARGAVKWAALPSDAKRESSATAATPRIQTQSSRVLAAAVCAFPLPVKTMAGHYASTVGPALNVSAEPGVIGRVKVVQEGRPVCERCYRQPERLCGRCGRVGRIARRATETSADLCDNCYQGVHAVCSVCNRVRPCLGSRSGTLICKSCLPRRRRACHRCRRIRPVNAEWPIGPVCSTCYEHIRSHPEVCAACGDVAPLIASDARHRGICGPCAGVAVRYNCRMCGQGGRIYADGTCVRCILAERLADLLQGADGNITSQLKPVHDALITVEHPITIVGWLRKRRVRQVDGPAGR